MKLTNLQEYILTEKTGFIPNIDQFANLVNERKKRKYFEEFEKILFVDTYRNLGIDKDDSKALEIKCKLFQRK